MQKDVRTHRGKLIGKLDARTGCLSIKDVNKQTMIVIPQDGLYLKYSPGDGVIEEVYIPPQRQNKTA
jgi:hypothetical protein